VESRKRRKREISDRGTARGISHTTRQVFVSRKKNQVKRKREKDRKICGFVKKTERGGNFRENSSHVRQDSPTGQNRKRPKTQMNPFGVMKKGKR